ncbi:thiol-disulfide isomerase [Vibrio sp. JCM 19236]|nr:thiol-disulfide isomerase [Vibrio sp. JCM 19236]
MKSITKTFALLICSLFFITACSENSTPELNKQYTQLPNDLSDMLDKPVVEVFSLTCGHCLQMEKFLPEIETRIEQPIGKVHVTFNESAQMAAMFYYAAEMQSQDGKVASEMMHDLFNIYHADQDKSQMSAKHYLYKRTQSAVWFLHMTFRRNNKKSCLHALATPSRFLKKA